jgi:putative colanic acid biosysnthesis UDP-glucose lipid carrier transferase
MTEPVYVKSGLKVGVVALLQIVTPAVVAVMALYLLTRIDGQEFNVYYRALAVMTVVLCALLMRFRSNGRPLIMSHPMTISLQLLARWLAILVALLLAGYAAGFANEYSRSLLAKWVVLVPLILIPAELLLHQLMRRITMSLENVRTAVIAGFNPQSYALAQKLAAHPEMCKRVLGFFDDRSADRLGSNDEFRMLGNLASLAGYVRANRVDVIFVALPIRHLERVMKLMDELHNSTASIYYVPDVFAFDLTQSRAGEMLGTPVVALCETPFYGFRGVLKRLTDIVLGLIGLIIALPVMLILSVLIRLTSKGPVIFNQRRYGLDGKEINVYKFRSMYVTEDGEKITQVTRDDPRITPIGRILRTYSLDELPQLFNVLQGKMSIVGPRPHAVAHNEQYRSLIKGYMLRHKVLPGITGLAQVNGCRGETSTVEEMQARVMYDLEYMRNWTPFLDLKILLLTVVRVFNDRKAY